MNIQGFIDLAYRGERLHFPRKRLKYSDIDDLPLIIDCSLTENIVGIMGHSGAGKTTLLKRLAGIQPCATQSIYMNGHNIQAKHLSHNPCVYVGADAPLFAHMSVKDNLALVALRSKWSGLQTSGNMCKTVGLSRVPLFSIQKAVELCEIPDVMDHNISMLSGGEKQRVELARALVSGKPILLLDEALSAMHWSLRTRIYQRLIRLSNTRARAIVLVSHSLHELALVSDHLVHIKNGLVDYLGPTMPHINPNGVQTTH